jgi:UDP-N-acetylglucosamine--N-acetylmuramyl-(pentapeptide) pyrophosphoryl-undecaprenol N-acetylglucosamine transferase
MKHSNHIVFAGGGTAGHLFPGLAVADVLARSPLPVRITMIGSGKPFECEQVSAAGYDYLALRCRPLPSRPGEALRFLTDNLSGFYSARRFLQESEVALVVGLGGYASAAATRAAANLRVPYVLLEQNVLPGRTTRWLASRATAVCAAFPQIRAHLRAGVRVRLTGTPLRREFRALRRARLVAMQEASPPRLLVLGGSGGSRTLNENAPRAIYKAQEALRGWEIVHQTGASDPQRTEVLYTKLGISARVAPFFEDLPQLLGTSALAVSRSGGTTLAELAACGVPSILLPYPRAADDHQRANALEFVAAGAAALLDSREVQGRLDNALAGEITRLAGDAAVRRQMGDKAARLARPDAAVRVAKLIAEMLVGEAAAAA